MRDTSDRRRRITAMVKEQGSVQVTMLSEMFGVSAQTIRKDLHYLADRGVATRAYGGAISADVVGTASSPVPMAAEPAVDTKLGFNRTEKEAIGKLAASLVKPGDSILLDSGTTTIQIAHHLPDIEDLTVVTNDFGVLSALATKQNIQIVMLGGALRRKNMAFYGAQTEAAIEELLVDKLFLGVDGFHLEKGITTHYENEARLNRKMATVANKIIAVTDSSKFGRMCLHRIIGVDEIDLLITDRGAPDYIKQGGLSCEVRIAP